MSKKEGKRKKIYNKIDAVLPSTSLVLTVNQTIKNWNSNIYRGRRKR